MRTATSRLMSLITVAVTAAFLVSAPSAAAASSWTTPQSFAAGKNVEIVPRAGIAPDGTSAAAWKTRETGLVGQLRWPPRSRSRRRASSIAGVPATGRSRPRRTARSSSPGGRPTGFASRRVRPLAALLSSAASCHHVVGDQRPAGGSRPRGGWVIVTREFPKNGTSQSTYGVRALSLDRGGPPARSGPGSRGGSVRDRRPSHPGTRSRSGRPRRLHVYSSDARFVSVRARSW